MTVVNKQIDRPTIELMEDDVFSIKGSIFVIAHETGDDVMSGVVAPDIGKTLGLQ